MIWAQSNSENDKVKLHELKDQYLKYMKLEESVLKLKTQLQWFNEVDAKSRYFHSLMRGRRRVINSQNQG